MTYTYELKCPRCGSEARIETEGKRVLPKIVCGTCRNPNSELTIVRVAVGGSYDYSDRSNP
jgi:hypothetical protein